MERSLKQAPAARDAVSASLDRLLRPKTVAMFGGDSAAEAIHRCRELGFDGEIWPVNPKREEMAGLRCFHSLTELPAAPDASFIAAPPATTVQIVRELRDAGAGGAVCYAAGFAELGEAGKALEQELREASRGMAVIGPNCHGFINFIDGVSLWPDLHGGGRVERGAALISQSGNVGINLTMQQRGLDLACVITIGNKSCLELHDYIDYLLTDARITAIGLYIEELNDIDRFTASAIAALRASVPIVAMKTGRSAQGASANLSHTASLSGEDRVYQALFDKYGIARSYTTPQFLETLKFLSTVGPLDANTLGSMSCSGGEAAMIADGADAVGLALPPLKERIAGELAEILGPKVPLSNPLDYHTYAWGNEEKLRDCFTAMLRNGNACTMLVLDYAEKVEDTANWQVAENALSEAITATGERAVIVSTLPETMPAEARARLKKAGITAMQGLDDCLIAISAAADVGTAVQRLDALAPLPAPLPATGQPRTLDEVESKAILAQAGVPVPRGRVCDAAEAANAADEIGYPVVIKAVSAELAHKTEHGAVALNLADRKAVEAAAATVAQRSPRLLVEAMAKPVVAELLVGASRDDTFGVSLTIGAGGTLVELLDDTAVILLPASRREIESALRSLKVAALVAGYRGGPAGDFAATLDAIAAIADYVCANRDQLVELDINPLIVMPDSVLAVDALIRLQDKDG